MVALGVNFDARQVAPSEPGLPVWEGLVPMAITRTEIKDTASNDGNKFLALHVRAGMGEYAGQDQVVRLNLYNKNAQAVDIAQRQLSSICHVTGRMSITDSDQLIGAPFIGVWAKEEREMTDQQTGQKRKVESCQCKDFRMIDGRTIKEAMSGQPASSPYQAGGAPSQVQPQPQMQPQPQPLSQQMAFAPPGAAGAAAASPGQFQPPGFPPPAGGAPAGFGGAGQTQAAPGGFGGQSAPQGQFQPPGAPSAGAGPWGQH